MHSFITSKIEYDYQLLKISVTVLIKTKKDIEVLFKLES